MSLRISDICFAEKESQNFGYMFCRKRVSEFRIYVHRTSSNGGTVFCQKKPSPENFLLYPLRHKNVSSVFWVGVQKN